MQKVLQLFKV